LAATGLSSSPRVLGQELLPRRRDINDRDINDRDINDNESSHPRVG